MRTHSTPDREHLQTLPGEGLHETVGRIAATRPHATAVIAGTQALTYGELDQLADGWAAQLCARGLRAGDLVPVLLPRGIDLVAAMLAVLKTGAAYALLDPTWPAGRVADVIGQLDAQLVIAEPDAAALTDLPSWSPTLAPTVAPPGFRPAQVDDRTACCVFFTSGTTGRSKGVLSPHRGTTRLFRAGTFAHFGADTVVPLAAPTPWDAFSLELWSVLLNGGTSVVVDEPYLSVHSLREAVSRHGVDTVWLTATLFNMLVDEDPSAFVGLRQVMTGGERMSETHARRFLRNNPSITLINGYGPVETTVFATTHRVTEADCARPGGIPLGQPVPGTEVFVLDGTRLCRPGEMGEICVAGEGLALRYLGDPELTASRFPVIELDGQPRRLYRTGDLGRWGPDGLLEFRGRADRQLKIRGHRVEPAEIEHQVETLLTGVRRCRVVPRYDADGHPVELLAFCVPIHADDELPGALDVLTASLLPHHRPAAVVSVDTFPLTSQGKLDEGALLARAPIRLAHRTPLASTPAVDPTVRLVAEVFAGLLGRPAVPLGASFFDLGGDSLLGGRVCARLGARLGRPVPVSALYHHPTVDDLAGWLRVTADVGTTDDGQAGNDLDDVPLSPMQLVFLTRHLADRSDRTGHCLLIWRVDGNLDLAALQTAVADVHWRHEPLRAVYRADPRPGSWPVDIAPPQVEVAPAQPSEGAAIRAVRARLAEDLEPMEADVWRTVVTPVATGQTWVFGCAVHHIAFDGWSESVLARDLSNAYNRLPPAPRPASLAEAAAHHAAVLARTDVEAQVAAVCRDLAGVPELVWPSVGEPGSEAPGLLVTTLSPRVVSAVSRLAAGTPVSRFVVLLAEWAKVVAEVTGQSDFAVGVPVAQRSSARLTEVVGCHITTLPVRLRADALKGGQAGRRATGQVFSRAFAACEAPLSAVVDRLVPVGTGRPPVFQVLFALQDNPPPRLELAGARTTLLRQPYLELPLELHTELWPDPGGGLRVDVAFRPDIVARAVAVDISARFTDRMNNLASEVLQ